MVRGRRQSQRRKKLIILRGLPGVGKTKRAKKLCDKYARLGLEAEIFSTDRYHESTNYTKGNFQRNHQRNREDVFKALNRGVDLIIVDNTNISLWEMWPYIHMGMRQGDYYITMMELPKNYISINKLYSRCQGNIPKKKFRSFEARWEDAYNIWHVLNDSYSINRWEQREEEWNVQ
ncbi:NEDD4-binding protein 2-like 1 isoform X2 [Salvelinus namaycush]|uniref:NEDD4-binding protein 2-like 1 isoform X2 n=1 Tax=Salvelinus namaycush TaxID=8040 RepID=A0A8U0TLY1_SALNM|nr:NEDD4-binding protein 2-like 1 isoform X2 [Salvelinus namaycush]